MNSIISQCSDCCTCPSPTVEAENRTVSANMWFTGSPNPCVIGDSTFGFYESEVDTVEYSDYDPVSDTCSGTGGASDTGAGSDPRIIKSNWSTPLFIPSTIYRDGFVRSDSIGLCCGPFTTVDGEIIGASYTKCRRSISTYSGLFDAAAFIERFSDQLAGGCYTFTFTGSFSSSSINVYLTYNESTGAAGAGKSRYRLRFKIPTTGSGTCYRVSWVERFIPEAGVGLTSIEVVSAGVFRPSVTWSGGGGTGLALVAVMASDGSVSAVRVLNPGSGFTSAPTITIATAINGGTTSTGWSATLAGDGVASVTRSGGTAGNYLPTLAFSGGGGSGASATASMDEQGGIASATLGAAGSGYAAAPSLTITAKVSGATAAVLHLHLGTETAKCAEWDGATPGGYDPATSSTYPTLPSASPGYFETAPPDSEGVVTIANVRAYCDCSSC